MSALTRTLLRRAPLSRGVSTAIRPASSCAFLPTAVRIATRHTPSSPQALALSATYPCGHRSYATHATPSDSKSPRDASTVQTQELESSIDAIVPDTLFDSSQATSVNVPLLPREAGRQAAATILQQLRKTVDAKSREEALQLESDATNDVRASLQQQGVSADSLHQFAISLLKHSRDPRRMPIASRLFVVAFAVDPMSLPDPTAPAKDKEFPTRGVDESLAGIPLAGQDAWAVNAAGYNWASMVLSGQAAPPAGLHLLARGSKEVREAITDQQAAAIRIYATLAMRGDAQGMLGMGRILIAGVHRQSGDASAATGSTDKQKQSEMMRDRAIALWTRAGEKGVSDAWFELGLLTLSSADGAQTSATSTDTAAADAQAKAMAYFERGAKADNARSMHALGVLLTQRAMQDNRSPSSPERDESLKKSMEHFSRAAELGDGESAHHMGMRYLLRQEMVEETGLGSEQGGRSPDKVQSQAADRHQTMWGVAPDDVQARSWFSKGADAGYMPAMMNLAGMLVEERGQDAAVKLDAGLRMQELRKAETLYAKVAATAGAMAQQGGAGSDPSQQQEANGAQVSMGHMAAFAQEALGKVRDALEKVVSKA